MEKLILPDVSEVGELSWERWADENVKGDLFKCSCGKWVHFDEGWPASCSPNALPICNECFDKMN